MTRHCPICGRYIKRGATDCAHSTPDLFIRAERKRAIRAQVARLFMVMP